MPWPTRVEHVSKLSSVILPPKGVVDAHHHLWDFGQGQYPWLQEAYDPEAFFLGDYQALQHNFLPNDYKTVSAGCNVVATVHVEAERDRSQQVAETQWLHEIYQKFGIPHAVVAHVWLDRPETEERLLSHVSFPLVRGIRSKPVTARTPIDDVRGQPGTMQDERWLRGLSMMTKLGLSWDLRVPAWHLAEAAKVAAMFPQLQIVLNHHGFAWDRTEAGLAMWRKGMTALAAQPNVHVKLSEFGLRDQAWIEADNAAIVHETVELFGWQRCMFASNFPVAGLRIGYADLVQAMWRMLSWLPTEQQQAVMAHNALRFYRIDLDQTPPLSI